MFNFKVDNAEIAGRHLYTKAELGDGEATVTITAECMLVQYGDFDHSFTNFNAE